MNIWIIGASSGIGSELARQYALAGHNVWISARNQTALDELANKELGLTPLPMDVTDNSSIIDAVNAIKYSNSAVDKIIINAGVCEYLDSYEIDQDKIERVMETNFFGGIKVVSHVLPLIRQSQSKYKIKSPQLVFVCSSVTYLALPRAGAYGASKAAIRYFAEALRADLYQESIDIRIVSPGFVETPLTNVNDFSMPFIMKVNEAVKRIMIGLEGSKLDIHFPKRFTYFLKLISILPDGLKCSLINKLSRHDISKLPNYE
ncbi:SDR family NAD(P)-dependent oxidoreductase [Oceaniserpentilla sp. 4NH20-0058]|uniref:SDR family NAD(P)-dependent oxidoreductase n=1 Tax=Oceaniserpentilla sp. 4NH20-0058 TaxID=3127660 RepID=UPI003101C046